MFRYPVSMIENHMERKWNMQCKLLCGLVLLLGAYEPRSYEHHQVLFAGVWACICHMRDDTAFFVLSVALCCRVQVGARIEGLEH